MMSYLDQRRYAQTTTWDSAYLMGRIKPIHVYNWMCFRTYGMEDPGWDDQPKRRVTTMNYWKKSISYFFHTTQKVSSVFNRFDLMPSSDQCRRLIKH